jgi:hypothetical protein
MRLFRYGPRDNFDRELGRRRPGACPRSKSGLWVGPLRKSLERDGPAAPNPGVTHGPADQDAASGHGEVGDDEQGVLTATLAASWDSVPLGAEAPCHAESRVVRFGPVNALSCGAI